MAVALPIIFFALSITLDLKRIYIQRRTIQDLADGAALVAAKNLPFKDLAKQRAGEYLALYKTSGSVEIGAADARVTIERSAPIIFARFFGKSIQAEVKVKAAARAMNSPKDVVLYMDTSSYMGPSVIYLRYKEVPPESNNWILDEKRPVTRIEGKWGDNKATPEDDGFWPSAQLFRDRKARFEDIPLLNPNPPSQSAGKDPNPPPSADDQRIWPIIATQQCFNPGLSAMKEAVIRAYDYYAASPLTNVAVMFGPNDDLDVGTAHPLEPGKPVSEPGVFGYYRSRYGRDEYCLKAAQYEQRHDGYKLPFLSTDLGARSSAFETALVDEIISDEQNFVLSPSSRPTVREIIWSKAVQRGYNNFLEQRRVASISKIFQAVGSTLLSIPQNRARGGLAENASKTAFIYLGDLPWEYDAKSGNFVRMSTRHGDLVRRAFKDSLAVLNTQAARLGVAVSIFITAMKHYGSYPECAESGTAELFNCERFYKEVQAYEEFAADLKFSNTKITVVRVPDFGTMGQEISALAPLIGNSSHLVR